MKTVSELSLQITGFPAEMGPPQKMGSPPNFWTFRRPWITSKKELLTGKTRRQFSITEDQDHIIKRGQKITRKKAQKGQNISLQESPGQKIIIKIQIYYISFLILQKNKTKKSTTSTLLHNNKNNAHHIPPCTPYYPPTILNCQFTHEKNDHTIKKTTICFFFANKVLSLCNELKCMATCTCMLS